MNCDNLIKAAIEKNCADPLVPGVERIAYIGNRAQLDFASLEFPEGSTNEVLNLPLTTGAQLYPIIQYGDKPFDGLKIDLTGGGKLGGTAATEISFIVPDSGPAVSENIIDPLLDGEFFIIWENRHKHLRDANEKERGASAFQIAGLFNGLTLSSGSWNPYDDGALSGWTVTLKADKDSKSAMYLNAGSLAATKTLIKTMLKPVTE